MDTPSRTVTDALLDALADEADALDRLAASADRQIEALRDGTPDRVGAASSDTAEAVAALDRAGRARARAHDAARRSYRLPPADSLDPLTDALPSDAAQRLREVRERVREAARTADRRCDALAFALRYAIELGRDTLAAWHDLGAERPAHVYTATGVAANATGRPLLNQTG